MKKFIALLLSILLLVSFSVTAFASKSPVAKPVFNVTIINGANADPVVSTQDGTDNLIIESKPENGKFDEWVIYKADGVTIAIEGVDYKVVEGSLTDDKLVITPLVELVICGNYNGVVTKPIIPEDDKKPEDDKETEDDKKPETDTKPGTDAKPETDKAPSTDKDESNKAPQTSDNLSTALSVVMIAALGFAVVSKKKISE